MILQYPQIYRLKGSAIAQFAIVQKKIANRFMTEMLTFHDNLI